MQEEDEGGKGEIDVGRCVDTELVQGQGRPQICGWGAQQDTVEAGGQCVEQGDVDARVPGRISRAAPIYAAPFKVDKEERWKGRRRGRARGLGGGWGKINSIGGEGRYPSARFCKLSLHFPHKGHPQGDFIFHGHFTRGEDELCSGVHAVAWHQQGTRRDPEVKIPCITFPAH